VVRSNLHDMRAGVVPDAVKTANREAHKRMMDAQTLGLMTSSAAASGLDAEDIEEYFRSYCRTLNEKLREHPIPIQQRLEKAKARTRFR